MKNFRYLFLTAVLFAAVSCGKALPENFTLAEGQELMPRESYGDFDLKARVLADEGSVASLFFHSDGESGYEVALRNGEIDGTCKTGSLLAVRNLYRSLASDGEWFDFEVSVQSKSIAVWVNGVLVVSYTEPDEPYRIPEFKDRVLSEGKFCFKVSSGKVQFADVVVSDVPRQPEFTSPAADEQNDRIIRLQQTFFPVIDYHVHLKGGLTKEMAHEKSLEYGINYGVAPNAGEGGVGRMLLDDSEVYSYYEEVKPLPFLCGVQGEGRRWTRTFSQEALSIFDYLFTDSMTILDHKGRFARIYRPEEVFYDGISKDDYVAHIVDETVRILTNEPADIYANPTFIPKDILPDYEQYWSDERINRVLDVLQKYDIALEINARYRIPSFKVISMAKERGLKFTFGTNNADPDFGRLEYCLDAVEACGITADDIWFPTMSVRASRPVILD